jgi:hypothetical protein
VAHWWSETVIILNSQLSSILFCLLYFLFVCIYRKWCHWISYTEQRLVSRSTVLKTFHWSNICSVFLFLLLKQPMIIKREQSLTTKIVKLITKILVEVVLLVCIIYFLLSLYVYVILYPPWEMMTSNLVRVLELRQWVEFLTDTNLTNSVTSSMGQSISLLSILALLSNCAVCNSLTFSLLFSNYHINLAMIDKLSREYRKVHPWAIL